MPSSNSLSECTLKEENTFALALLPDQAAVALSQAAGGQQSSSTDPNSKNPNDSSGTSGGTSGWNL